MVSCKSVWDTYWPLVKFLIPLGLTNIAPDIADQALNRGITSIESDNREDITDALASFGLALSLLKFIALPLSESRHIGLVMVHSQQDRRKSLFTVLIVSGFASSIFLILGFSPLGTLLLEDLHKVKHSVSEDCKTILTYMMATPILETLCMVHAGILLQHRHSFIVGASSIADVLTQVIMVIILVNTNLIHVMPTVIPVIALYAGYNVRLAIILTGYYYKPGIQYLLPNHNRDQEALRVKKILTFFWPLVFISMVQKVSRPVVNLFVARDQASSGNAEKAVATLVVLYPISRVFYGWLNNLKEVQPAFAKATHGHRAYSSRERIIFSIGCLAFSILITFPTFYIPGVTQTIMFHLMNIDWELAGMTVTPLKIFAFMSLAVAFRSYFTGWLMIKRKTKYVAPSGVLRMLAILLACIVFPLIGVHGASMGVSALLCGFMVEALTVFAGSVFVWKWKNYTNEKAKTTHDTLELPADYNPRISAMFGSQDLHAHVCSRRGSGDNTSQADVIQLDSVNTADVENSKTDLLNAPGNAVVHHQNGSADSFLSDLSDDFHSVVSLSADHINKSI